MCAVSDNTSAQCALLSTLGVRPRLRMLGERHVVGVAAESVQAPLFSPFPLPVGLAQCSARIGATAPVIAGACERGTCQNRGSSPDACATLGETDGEGEWGEQGCLNTALHKQQPGRAAVHSTGPNKTAPRQQ